MSAKDRGYDYVHRITGPCFLAVHDSLDTMVQEQQQFSVMSGISGFGVGVRVGGALPSCDKGDKGNTR